MATFWFNKGREGFADGSFSWTGSSIYAALIDTTKYNPAATTSDKFLSVPAAISGAIVARTTNSGLSIVTAKTAVDGILDCDDITWSSVTNGAVVGAIIFYYNAGSDGANRMIMFIDNAGGFPFTGNGGDATYQVPSSGNLLGKL